tara:strand:+ start:107 stop:286 length:180 start_codon:yes stop_codon:yes gene_type:complete
MTTIKTTINTANGDEIKVAVENTENYGVIAEFSGNVFTVKEIEKLLSHMKYLDNLEDEE